MGPCPSPLPVGRRVQSLPKQSPSCWTLLPEVRLPSLPWQGLTWALVPGLSQFTALGQEEG